MRFHTEPARTRKSDSKFALSKRKQSTDQAYLIQLARLLEIIR